MIISTTLIPAPLITRANSAITPGVFLCASVSRRKPRRGSDTAGKFTEYLMFPFSRKSWSSSAIMTAQLSSALLVLAPRCGSTMTLSWAYTVGLGKSVT